METAREKAIADHDRAVWFMWHAESLARAKKLPHMKAYFYKEKKTAATVDETAIMARLKAYNAQLEKQKPA